VVEAIWQFWNSVGRIS
jgi:hypothetical protein